MGFPVETGRWKGIPVPTKAPAYEKFSNIFDIGLKSTLNLFEEDMNLIEDGKKVFRWPVETQYIPEKFSRLLSLQREDIAMALSEAIKLRILIPRNVLDEKGEKIQVFDKNTMLAFVAITHVIYDRAESKNEGKIGRSVKWSELNWYEVISEVRESLGENDLRKKIGSPLDNLENDNDYVQDKIKPKKNKSKKPDSAVNSNPEDPNKPKTDKQEEKESEKIDIQRMRELDLAVPKNMDEVRAADLGIDDATEEIIMKIGFFGVKNFTKMKKFQLGDEAYMPIPNNQFKEAIRITIEYMKMYPGLVTLDKLYRAIAKTAENIELKSKKVK